MLDKGGNGFKWPSVLAKLGRKDVAARWMARAFGAGTPFDTSTENSLRGAAAIAVMSYPAPDT